MKRLHRGVLLIASFLAEIRSLKSGGVELNRPVALSGGHQSEEVTSCVR